MVVVVVVAAVMVVAERWFAAPRRQQQRRWGSKTTRDAAWRGRTRNFCVLAAVAGDGDGGLESARLAHAAAPW